MANETTDTDQNQRQAEHFRQQADQFQQQADQAPPGLLAEFVDFLLHNKKWWLTPIILVLLLLGVLVILSASGLPFIYPV
jgi:mannose/fructose/N-acetylgalactosamine-specific phosphotransferase system component IID